MDSDTFGPGDNIGSDRGGPCASAVKNGTSVLDTADQPSTTDVTKPIVPDRVQALLGIACALTVAASLGLPGLDVGATFQILLVVVGFRLARVVHRRSSDTNWRVPLVLGLAGRAVPTVALVVALVGLHRVVTGGTAPGEALALIGSATFIANIVPFVADASFGPVDHMWVVALVAQTAVVAPWLLTAKRHQLCPRNRGLLLFAAAGLMVLIRMIVVAATGAVSGSTGTEAWLTPPDSSLIGAVAVWTSLDAVMIGLAIGTLPLSTLHRHPTTRLATPAVAGLALLLVVPPIGPPIVDVGLRLPLAAVLTATVLASEAISSLPGWLSRTLTNAWWHRLGSRTFGLYLWHLPFAYGLTDGRPFDWHGPFVFVVIVTLTLAAATTTYRSIEIPTQVALARVASRWYLPDAVLLPRAEPQFSKWVRWDDISLDSLPRPTLRRNRRPSGESTAEEPLGRRLWQLGDREIDLRPRRPGHRKLSDSA